jgi:curved DNA-binding protein CbpA
VSDIARCYGILGLEPGASAEEVKQAWRDLAQVWHPDRFAGNERLRQKAQEKLTEVNEAYQVLRDESAGQRKRAASEPYSSPTNNRWQRPENGFDTVIDQRALLLNEGVNAWNLWRKKYADVRPDLQGANLRGADLAGADLREANLSGTILVGADLYKANLSAARLAKAKLATADASRATLIATDLTSADLENADLSSTDLSQARLVKALLTGANLVGASLEGADLSGAIGLTRGQVAEAITNAATRLPGNLR